MKVNVTAETATTTSDDVASNVSLILGEMGHAASRIDYAQVSRLADEISGAERVFLAGAGRSGLVLRMAAMRLMHLGKTVHVAGDTTTPAINAGDLLIVASGSGTTSGVVKAAQTALSAGGAQVAAITTNPSSPPWLALPKRWWLSPRRPEDGPWLRCFAAVLRQPLRTVALPGNRGVFPFSLGSH